MTNFEQRVVQQHELADGGQAAVRLEAVDWPLERSGECRRQRVGDVGAAAAVGVLRWRGTAATVAIRALAGYVPATDE